MRERTVGDLRHAAKAVLPHVTLEQVYAVHTEFHVHDRFQTTPLSCSTDLRVRGEQTGDRVEVWARYETRAQSEDETDVWTAIVEAVAVFALDASTTPPDEDQVEAFALLVGMPALHPYAREWTQTLTSQSQYPAFTMGLMDSPAELDEAHVIQFPDRDGP